MATEDSERRAVSDRRRKPTPPLSVYSLIGRRRGPRRQAEFRLGQYVDRYGYKSVLALVSVVTLGVMDGIFTLYLVEHGAKEVNPVMDFFLDLGAGPFLGVKYTLTGVSALALLMHKNFCLARTRLRVKHVVVAIFCLYALLVAYELVLISAT